MSSRKIAWIAVGAASLVAAVSMLIFRDDNVPKHSPSVTGKLITLPDTLRAITLYGPNSYFLYREQPMGTDYDLLTRFAKDNGMVLDLKVATSIPEMLQMLRDGKVDMVAYDVPRISEYKRGLRYCGKNTINHQVLVQPQKMGLRDVSELIGHTVYVEKNSKYQYRLSNLNDELGGGIGIEAVVSDTLENIDLVRMVNDSELPLTVTDSDMATAVGEVYHNLDMSLAVSMDQYSSWVVSDSNKLLGDLLDKWISQAYIEINRQAIQKKYFEHIVSESSYQSQSTDSNGTPINKSGAPTPQNGVISPYDAYFRHYAQEIGWDWRQLASIGYTESKFNPSIVSWAGARGLMQIMPTTAKRYGIAGRTENPEASIMAASKILLDLDKSLQKSVSDPGERRKFVIAAYNSGLGHIQDAIALARKYGRNPQVWYGNVREMAMLKTKPQYYNDPVVKHGYFRGQETVNFVDRVLSTYQKYCSSTAK